MVIHHKTVIKTISHLIFSSLTISKKTINPYQPIIFPEWFHPLHRFRPVLHEVPGAEIVALAVDLPSERLLALDAHRHALLALQGAAVVGGVETSSSRPSVGAC